MANSHRQTNTESKYNIGWEKSQNSPSWVWKPASSHILCGNAPGSSVPPTPHHTWPRRTPYRDTHSCRPPAPSPRSCPSTGQACPGSAGSWCHWPSGWPRWWWRVTCSPHSTISPTDPSGHCGGNQSVMLQATQCQLYCVCDRRGQGANIYIDDP